MRVNSGLAQGFGASIIDTARLKPLNTAPAGHGDYVLYWMQQSQRSSENHALTYAVEQANHLRLPLLVVFGLADRYPEANCRHYTFMLEGLRETQKNLLRRGIQMVVRRGDPPAVAAAAAGRAAAVICDRGYLPHQRRWRHGLAENAACSVVQVESDLIVPVETASDHAEYAARTLRPKIYRRLPDYLKPVPSLKINQASLGIAEKGLDLSDPAAAGRALSPDTTVAPVSRFFKGGTAQAKKRFKIFLAEHLPRYAQHRNQPQTDDVSSMSPYLHFGQISPLYLALQVQKAGAAMPDAAAAYLEELLVQRELAANFVYFTPHFDRYESLPEWARRTLREHASDSRDYLYTRRELEDAATHDPYWNAAMREMKHTGFMHNYMRMYWGKKIIEWSASARDAFETARILNNQYFLDGRDANSYAGLAWLFGLHDRPWPERNVFGKVRYMAASGLERKCDIQAYVRKIDRRVQKAARI